MKKERPFRRERGVSRRRIGAASCSQSRARQHIAARAQPTGDREKWSRAVAVVVLPVGGRFGRRSPHLRRARQPQPHPRGPASRTFRARRGHERAPRSRTFHSPPDQSRTEVKLVFSAAAPPLSRG
ncbi:hypothetical protein PVAP13_9NG739677 [Panicum virgatum]|uniref:Uncharacterized protein n=1 Tax=Panicum virgatum TaxID=38727 RepID=A0A8T0N8D2_PANVG|nr:hypothetical protein PVAP13_9NG739677 [Panicum virgatum]